MTMQRMTPVKMNRSQCARHISNGCTLLLFLEERTMNDASHLRYFGVQPLLFSTHSYSKHFSLDMWSCCFHIPFKNNYIWKITNQFKTLQNCLKTCRWDLSHCPLNGVFWCYIYSNIVKADLSKTLYVPGHFSSNENTSVSALFSLSLQQSLQLWGQRRTTDGKRSQVRVEGIAAAGQTSQGNSHAKC